MGASRLSRSATVVMTAAPVAFAASPAGDETAWLFNLSATYSRACTRPGTQEVHYQGAEGLSVEKVAQHMGQRSVQTVRSWYLDIRVPPMAVFQVSTVATRAACQDPGQRIRGRTPGHSASVDGQSPPLMDT